MRLKCLDLTRYGKFTDHRIEFGERLEGQPDLHIVYGPNEAGKSTALAGFLDLLFGIETRSRFNFIHPYPTMRIGGTLELAGGPQELVRIKRPQNSLLDARDQPIAEGALLGELGGVDRESYRTMFSLDDATLEAGGESILSSKGDLGQLLFSASAGLADLSKGLVDLKTEAEGFYKYRARSGELSDLKARLGELKAERERIDTLASDYAQLIEARDRAAIQYEEAIVSRSGIQARMDEIQRHLNALPRLTDLRALRERIAPVADLPDAPRGWADELPQLQKDEIELGIRAQGLTEEIAELSGQLDAIVVDEAALRLADKVERLADLRARHVTAEKDIPERHLQLREAELAISAILGQIDRTGETSPDRLVLGASVMGALRALIETRSGIEAALKSAADERSEARRRLDEAQAKLREAGGDPQIGPGRETRMSSLAATVAAARADDHAARRRLAERTRDAARVTLADRLRELRPWNGDIDELVDLSAPDAGEIQHWTLATAEAQKRIDQYAGEVERLTTEQIRLTAELDALSGISGLVSDQEAASIRASREQAWAAHRDKLDKASADGFEAALRRDDIVTNGRLGHMGGVAKLHLASQALAIVKAECDRAIELRNVAATALQSIQREIASVVAATCPALSDSMSLPQFEAWLGRRDKVLEARGLVRAAESDLREAEADAVAVRDRLAAALRAAGLPQDADARFEALLVAGQGAIDREVELKALRASEDERQRDLSSREREVEKATEADRDWNASWTKACSACWLGEGGTVPTLATIREILVAITELSPVLEKKANLVDRIGKMEKDQTAFRDEVEALAREMGIIARSGDTLDLAQAVSGQVQVAQAEHTRRATAAQNLEAARIRQRTLSETLAIHDRRKTEMIAFFGVATLAEVSGKLSAIEKRAELAAQAEAAERDILAALRLPTIDKAEAALDLADHAALEAELVERKARFDDQDERSRDMFSTHSKALDRVEAVGGDGAVARIEEEKRTLLLDIEDRALRYLRLKLGAAAAEQALRAYRDRHRSSMMARASDAFATISRGAYTGLITCAADALAVVLNERGRVDLEHIAELLHQDIADVVAELGDAIFQHPADSAWQMADAYLSGPVRDKLKAAEAATTLDPAFERNVRALVAVQPADLGPSDITARLGAPWIPASDVVAFVKETMGAEITIRHMPELASWTVDARQLGWMAAGTSDWGTGRRHAGELLTDALNSRIPQIFDTIREGGSERRVLNVVDTEAAKEKLQKIKTAFQSWVWSDPDRTDRLARIYNDRFNNIAPRAFDGSHLKLPGASGAFTLYPHQKRGIWRIVAAGSTYLAHAVGAGKTMTFAAAVMEQRRLGLIAKAMLVVPGHCLAQVAREFLALYPNARILVADESNFTRDKRHRFLSRAASATWDAIIITHSAFRFIDVPSAFEQRMIQDELELYESLLTKVESDDRVSRKRIERLKEGLKERLEALSTRKDDLLTISELGIDQIIVDEAQEFRKLSFATNMSTLKGVDPNGSQRAWDLYVKSRFVDAKNPGRALVLASGTPITNTLGEMFSVQRLMDHAALKERGLHEFDAWASTFGDTTTELELQPSGKYKPVSRFASFVNVPELIAMFRSFADVVTPDDLRRYVKVPAISTGRRQILTAKPTPAFKSFQRLLDERIKAIEMRDRPPQPGDDILLSVITDGRHAAIDLRLVDPDNDNEPENKLNLLVGNAFRIWRETAVNAYVRPDGKPFELGGAAQMIFSDLGTISVEKSRGFSAYRWIRDELVRRGVPVSEIAFMQDFKKSEAKQRLFGDVRAGKVRFLIGSSETMGTGVNAQLRLKALHHLDVPWLPSQIEQREGRIVRQGNQHDEVDIFAYATQGSLDATMWQNNERKARFIAAALSGDTSIRRLEDLGEGQANQFAMAKAIASGDQRLMQKAGLESEIARLERLRAAHQDDQFAVRRQIRDAERAIEVSTRRVSEIGRDIERRIPTAGDAFAMTVMGTSYSERKEAGRALLKEILTLVQIRREEEAAIATISGFDLEFSGERVGRDGYRYDTVLLRTGADHELDLPVTVTPLGAVARLEHALGDFEGERERYRQRLTEARRRLASYRSREGGEFAFGGELAEKRRQLVEIEKALASDTDGTETANAA